MTDTQIIASSIAIVALAIFLALVWAMMCVGADADSQQEELAQKLFEKRRLLGDKLPVIAESMVCGVCLGSGYSDYASFAIDPCPACRPAPIALSEGRLSEAEVAALKAQIDRSLSSSFTRIHPVEPTCRSEPEDVAPLKLIETAVRHSAVSLAELTRYQVEGASSDRFPLDEDVEIHLAKALQSTVNILLSHQPSEHEREELGQLEAALHKFITDYGS